MTRKLRTAVLVVHGIGSQRPLDTVRGVINAVWFDDDDHTKGNKKLWSHPEPSGVDLDLTVMTTNSITGKPDGRVADFHELYWAHLMSETKAVAVLLWLFELGRRGPFMRAGMNGLWSGAAIYLCLLLLSASLLAMKAVVWVAGIAHVPYEIALVLALMLLIAVAAAAVAAFKYRYWKLGVTLAIALIVMSALGWLAWSNGVFDVGSRSQILLTWLTNVVVAPGLAFVAACLLMGRWGRCAFAVTYGLSLVFFCVMMLAQLASRGWEKVYNAVVEAHVAWALPSQASAIAAFTIIGVYLILNAAFLQPYLGDAARYFRNSPANVRVRRAIRKNAVDTLDQLHRSRDYDRIVVVAHSLGTVVAYDMLRAYYSRICDQIPVDKEKLNPQFDAIDRGPPDRAAMRTQGRELIGKLAAASALLDPSARQDSYRSADDTGVDAWLVTDFVTLGCALVHARYLMVNEDNGTRLDQDFEDHVRERALPTCPPQLLDSDGRLSFSVAGKIRFHHGGMFGMTRWTNLFFPLTNVFWGDGVGGAVAPVFGDCVEDIEVWTDRTHTDNFFPHTWYWKTDCAEKRDAPHIKALLAAINLDDKP
jgi:hypothetical protein